MLQGDCSIEDVGNQDATESVSRKRLLVEEKEREGVIPSQLSTIASWSPEHYSNMDDIGGL